MNTHLSIEQLSEIADDLDDQTTAVAVHLRTCELCTDRVKALLTILESARALPREMTPPPELWTKIRAEIGGAGRAARSARRAGSGLARFGWYLAAAAVILVVLTAATTAYLVRARDSASARLANGGESPSPGAGVVPTSLLAIDRSYQPTLAELTAALAANRDKLAPATVARVERNLRIIDDAIVEVRDALTRDPNNTALTQLLSANYRQKIELLRRVSEWVPTS